MSSIDTVQSCTYGCIEYLTMGRDDPVCIIIRGYFYPMGKYDTRSHRVSCFNDVNGLSCFNGLRAGGRMG